MAQAQPGITSDFTIYNAFLPQAQVGGLISTNAPALVPVGLQAGPPPAPLTHEMLTETLMVSYDAVNRIAMQTARWNPDALIQNKGWDALDEMKTMAVYDSPLRLVKFATLYKDHTTNPRYLSADEAPDEATYKRGVEAANLCKYVINNIYDATTGEQQDFRKVLWYILDAVHAGYSVMEIVWRLIPNGQYKGKYGLERFIPRRPQQIGFRIDALSNKVLDLVNFTSLGGYQYYIPLRKCLLYTYQGRNGLPYGWGVARTCYKHTYSINELVRSWGLALQKHGGGFLMGTSTNPNPDYMAKMRALMDNIQNSASIVKPEGLTIEAITLAGGALEVFGKALEYHEGQIVKEILGQSLTTGQGSGPGSYALGSVHQDTQEYFLAYPRRDIELLVEQQLYRRIIEENYVDPVTGEGSEYLDVIPTHSQGVYDNAEREMLAKIHASYIENGVLHPVDDNDWMRAAAKFPPALPTTLTKLEDLATIPLLPGREKINLGNTAA